jgi:hypothetical protein
MNKLKIIFETHRIFFSNDTNLNPISIIQTNPVVFAAQKLKNKNKNNQAGTTWSYPHVASDSSF